MSVRLIRVSSRRTGERQTVRVYVYDDLEELRSDGAKFDPFHEPGFYANVLGLCQAYKTEKYVDGAWVVRRAPVVVRLWRGALGTLYVTHEMSHAATEIYGRSLPQGEDATEHLHNANEVLAHLHSDLISRLVNRLYECGYYDRPPSGGPAIEASTAAPA